MSHSLLLQILLGLSSALPLSVLCMLEGSQINGLTHLYHISDPSNTFAIDLALTEGNTESLDVPLPTQVEDGLATTRGV
jgi:hypothetical protein